jgi:hypothetical protein
MHTKLATTRRQILTHLGVAGAALMSRSALADTSVLAPLTNDQPQKVITTAFPQKGAMILLRTRPPLLETPFEVFEIRVHAERCLRALALGRYTGAD